MQTKGKQPEHEESSKGDGGTPVATRTGTGPRTVIGKSRSKYNALKSGIFSAIVVLSNEPRSQFESLLRGLQTDLQPQGMLETIIVEKLATTLWRYRRLLQAETGEVLKNLTALHIERRRQTIAGLRASAFREQEIARTDRRGYIADIFDRNVLELCLDKLYVVIENAERFGLDYKGHLDSLGLLYGARYAGRPGKDLFDFYLECVQPLTARAAVSGKGEIKPDVDCVRKFTAETEKEIRRLEARRKHTKWERKWPSDLEDEEPRAEQLLECAIPQPDEMDRLLRYEANLERAIERILNQLEQLQRMRNSQTVIEVSRRTAVPG